MTHQNRIAHLTGFGSPAPKAAFPGPVFKPRGIDTAPGVTGGHPDGFSIAIGFRAYQGDQAALPVVSLTDTPGEPAPTTDVLPNEEFLAAAWSQSNTHGYYVNVEEGADVEFNFRGVDFSIGKGVAADQTPDLIMLASYIPDMTRYGYPGNEGGAILVNGDLLDQAIAVSVLPYTPGDNFNLLGVTAPAFDTDAQDGFLGGAYRMQVSSFWITPGIPTQEQAAAFFRASMQSGIVIPQAWAGARTPANPNPTIPSSPTGHFWSAADVKLNEGLGTVWIDRINGVELELVGPTMGDVRAVAVEPDYYWNPTPPPPN